MYSLDTEVRLSFLEAKHLQNKSSLPSHARTSAPNLHSQGSNRYSIPSELPAAPKKRMQKPLLQTAGRINYFLIREHITLA